jgi:hypothetical protein
MHNAAYIVTHTLRLRLSKKTSVGEFGDCLEWPRDDEDFVVDDAERQRENVSRWLDDARRGGIWPEKRV